MPKVYKYFPVPFFGILFVVAIFKVNPPQSLTQASFLQLASFFLPLFLFFVFLSNLYFKFLQKSILISLSLIIALILKALGGLNLLSLPLLIAASALIFRLIPAQADKSKSKFHRSQTAKKTPSLLKSIPKATPPKISRVERKPAAKTEKTLKISRLKKSRPSKIKLSRLE